MRMVAGRTGEKQWEEGGRQNSRIDKDGGKHNVLTGNKDENWQKCRTGSRDGGRQSCNRRKDIGRQN